MLLPECLVAVEYRIACRDILLDLVAAYRLEGVPFGEHGFGLCDLRGDLCGVELREVDADGGFVFGILERALHVAQGGRFEPGHVVGLRKCLVVLVDQFYRDEEQVVRQGFTFHERKRIDLELVGVDALFCDFDGFGITRLGIRRIACERGTGADRCRSDARGEQFENVSHCLFGYNVN